MYAVKRTAAPAGVAGEVRSLGERARGRVRTGNERGQSLLELALTLPILLLVMTGIFTFGIAYNHYLILTDAAAAGGRAVGSSRGQTSDPCQTAAQAVYGAAPLLALNQANLKFSITLDGAAVASGAANPSCSSSGAVNDLVQGKPATVVVQYPCDLSVFGVNYSHNCQLTASTTEIIQ
jgi:Flp pilus assembly protein TadG